MAYQVGFIGLGRMGTHMASHIHSVAPCGVWNRTRDVAVQHSKQHETVLVNSIESFRCPVVFCCLPTSAEVREAAVKLVEARKAHILEVGSHSNLPPNVFSLLVDCTSGAYSDTVSIGAYLRDNGVSMVDCPVSGGPRGAKAGALTAMLGGAEADVETAIQYAKSFAKKANFIGPLGSGHAVKSINNILNTANLMAITEGLLALKKIGVDPEKALASINCSSGRSLQSMERIPEEVLTGRFNYGFDFNLMRKDVRIAGALLEKESGALFETGVLRSVVSNMEIIGDAVLAERRGTGVAGPEGGPDLSKPLGLDYTYLSAYMEKQAGINLRSRENGS